MWEWRIGIYGTSEVFNNFPKSGVVILIENYDIYWLK